MIDVTGKADGYFADELARLRKRFVKRDYSAFVQALHLCIYSERPLPQWISDVVLRQAEDIFNSQSTGPGRTGNWRAALTSLRIHESRANLVDFHVRARAPKGRRF